MSVSNRLDKALMARGLVLSRSQAESFIKLGKVNVNGKTVTKPATLVLAGDELKLKVTEQYVNRAALKLASVAAALKLDFKGKVVLDVGSSTGGFTDYALKHGVSKVIAVDVGTDQMHPSLRNNLRIELHEKTDIRNVWPRQTEQRAMSNEERAESMEQRIEIEKPDIVLIDVSFISLREILPHCSRLTAQNSLVVAMVKPQFEAGDSLKHKGVIKNDTMRRNILKDFETWVQKLFKVIDKADSRVHGGKGNIERFYLLKPLNK
ncbi:MAG: TlyA family RNA methyltransferase [Patescibacteria group bacterium]